MNTEVKDKIRELAGMIVDSQKTMVLTGAGISTNSGLPDFRSQRGGLWKKVDPMKFLTRQFLLEEPEKFYKHIYSNPRLKKDAMPQPNLGHRILAELEERGLIDGIITQNVDHLHHGAGSNKVYEVHGNINDGYCIDCGRYISTSEIIDKVEDGEVPPRCNHCGGVVRSSVVLFGDPLPEAFAKAKEEVENAYLLIVIGSTLMVSPINSITLMADKLAIINNEETKRDSYASIIIREDASIALEELRKELNKLG